MSNTKTWKSKVEQGFGKLGLAIGKHPIPWFIGCLIVVGLLASQLSHLRQDSSMEGYLEKDSIEIKNYDQFRETFGRDETFVITIEVDDIFTQDFADKLHALHQEIEDEVPYIKTVDSLANARYTYGADDTLYIEELLPKTLPKDPIELKKLKDYTFASENYKNVLISEDGGMTAVVARLQTYRYEKDKNGKEQRYYIGEDDMIAPYEKLKEIVAKYQNLMGGKLTVTGAKPIALVLTEVMGHDFMVFSSLANLIIGIVLYIIFRRFSGVIMPLLIMALGITITMSLMAVTDTPMQVSTSILPSFLLAVCVGDSIHLLTLFYRNFDAGDEKAHAIAGAMEHTGLAIFFTSITTAAGLASFAMSHLTLIASLGIFGAVGSMIAFLLTIIILPCLIALLPLKRKPLNEDRNKGLNPLLLWCSHTACRHPKSISFIGAILFVGGLALASQSSFSHYGLDWMPQDDPVVQALKNYQQRMGSTLTFEILLDTGKERGIINADFLQALDEVQQEVLTWDTENYEMVQGISVVNIIKESNRALHDNDQAHFKVPDDPALISQELFLVELDEPDDILNVVDENYQIARLTITKPWFDSMYMKEIMDKLEPYLDEKLGPFTKSITITGVSPILGTVFAEMLISTAESYSIAAIVITLMMVLLLGSIKLGLLSMIPSLVPIFVVLSVVHLLGIPLDVLTMLTGSIAIGLTVDDNVHFMHGFRRVYVRTGDPQFAIEQTLVSSGRAMLITSIVLGFGFLIYTQSQLSNMTMFGIMTASCIILALFATFLLAPALMMLFNKDLTNKEKELKQKLGKTVELN